MLGVSQFSDVAKKLAYHKQEILKEFVQKGVYPDNALIESRLNSIDMHLAIFQHYNVVPGQQFDANEYNKSLQLIYEDLKILYDLLYQFQVEEYYKQQNFINSYINELNSVVDTYKKRADFENSSTTFGRTLLFQNNNFTINNDNSTTIIELNTIKAENASELTCLANIHNVNPDNLLFTFTDPETNKTYQVSPYNYSGETLTMPGTKTTNTYNIEMTEDQKITGPLILSTGSAIDPKNKYTILAGKNKMFLNYKNKNSFDIQDIPTSLGSYMFTDKTYINFYVVDGNSVTFKFNKKPIATNFPTEEQRITNLKPIHHFFIECDKDFSFEIELDKGNVYGVKENGVINNNKLYYTGTNLVRDFSVIEESSGDTKEYKSQLKIFNNNEDNFDIESIIIKQIE